MDKISKALKKLSSQEKKIAKLILENIAKNDFKNLDIKKLKGHDNIFRVRKGKIRIIYKTNKDNSIFILTIERRSDKTYKF
ncbi:type II toxin-antitoxin system RelE/ParE family toxin [Patescibacteria group bacterium]|nr:type II toxin-antitoxin system RelE/ParE family toxin [Patescibacteria group bacterium]MBU2219343.1 type II toxin-antitoxin system RelE/ParE family toxin [Patescibacteria group bacterium]MBU2263328.1 type II toxin-antitoxin system RelE/ParE family toxin [Patescibacteria group bacterium]